MATSSTAHIPVCPDTGICVDTRRGVRHVVDLLCRRHADRISQMEVDDPPLLLMNTAAKYALSTIASLDCNDRDKVACLILKCFTDNTYIRQTNFSNNWFLSETKHNLMQSAPYRPTLPQMREYPRSSSQSHLMPRSSFINEGPTCWRHPWMHTLNIKYYAANSIFIQRDGDDGDDGPVILPIYTTPPAAPVVWAAAYREPADENESQLMLQVERYRTIVTFAANRALTEECDVKRGAAKVPALSALLVSMLHPLMAALAHEQATNHQLDCELRVRHRLRVWVNSVYSPCDAIHTAPDDSSIEQFSLWTKNVMIELTSHVLANTTDFCLLHKLSRVGERQPQVASHTEIRKALGQIFHYLLGDVATPHPERPRHTVLLMSLRIFEPNGPFEEAFERNMEMITEAYADNGLEVILDATTDELEHSDLEDDDEDGPSDRRGLAYDSDDEVSDGRKIGATRSLPPGIWSSQARSDGEEFL